MIVIRVQLTVQPDKLDEFQQVMLQDRDTSLAFAGCLRFDTFQHIGDETTFLLYEEWETQEHFEAYRTSAHFKAVGGKIFPMLAQDPDSAYYTAAVLELA